MMNERWQRIFGACVALVVFAGCGQIDVDKPGQQQASEATKCRDGGSCWIEGACYLPGQEMPGNRCQSCEPEISDNGFTKTQCEADETCEPQTGLCVAAEGDASEDAESGVQDVPILVDSGGADAVGPVSDAVEDVVEDAVEVEDIEADDALVPTLCGDGSCGSDEDCVSCAEDCGECLTCEEGKVISCDGSECIWSSWFGDGQCDPLADCEGYDWDGGDCCADGLLEGCQGEGCVPPELLGDGTCTPELACDALEWDQGDCSCPEPKVYSCVGTCVLGLSIQNGTCDETWNCQAHDFDGGDCCGEGQVFDCQGGCIPEALVGNGNCDEALACATLDWDSGDCAVECPGGEIVDCGGGCHLALLKGDGVCSPEFQCEAHGWDGGDCCADDESLGCEGGCFPTASLTVDGVCAPAFACAEYDWDGGDCPILCDSDRVLKCDGTGCVKASLYNNGVCNPVLDCDTYGFDGGDCCPDGQLSVCESCFPADENLEAKVGDGQCNPELSCAETDYDAGDCPPSCASDELACPGAGCLAAYNLGDGICNPELNCGELDLDGGDCCLPGEDKDCDFKCVPLLDIDGLKANGTCDATMACDYHAWDAGACPVECGEGAIATCNANCAPPSWLGDGQCDPAFACEAFNHDLGDCCPSADQVKSCGGACVASQSFGDGTCDAVNQCPEMNWDGGDCPPVCGSDEVVACDASACLSLSWLADDYCDALLVCEENAWDGGDCCGDGTCVPGEPEQCPEDCVGWCANNTSLEGMTPTEPTQLPLEYPQENGAPIDLDVVMGPDGRYFAAWLTQGKLTVSDFPATADWEGLAMGTQVTTTEAAHAASSPAVALSPEGKLAVVYRRHTWTGGGLLLRRYKPDFPDNEAYQEDSLLLEAELPGDVIQSVFGRPEVAWALQDRLFITTLYKPAGGAMQPVVLRVEDNGEIISGGFDPLAGGDASSEATPSIARKPDGSAMVTWLSPPQVVDGADVQGPRRLNFQGVHISGDFEAPFSIELPAESLTSFDFSPAIAVDPNGVAVVVVGTLAPAGLWGVRFDTVSKTIIENGQLVSLEGNKLPSFGAYNRSYDVAMNGDGWGLVAVGISEQKSLLVRIPPEGSASVSDTLFFGTTSAQPRIGAATCLDDAVVMTGTLGVGNTIERTRFLTDADGNGVPDFCCEGL